MSHQLRAVFTLERLARGRICRLNSVTPLKLPHIQVARKHLHAPLFTSVVALSHCPKNLLLLCLERYAYFTREKYVRRRHTWSRNYECVGGMPMSPLSKISNLIFHFAHPERTTSLLLLSPSTSIHPSLLHIKYQESIRNAEFRACLLVPVCVIMSCRTGKTIHNRPPCH